MTRQEALTKDKSFYADFSDEIGMYCVFGDNSGFAYSQHGSQAKADEAAIEMDNFRK